VESFSIVKPKIPRDMDPEFLNFKKILSLEWGVSGYIQAITHPIEMLH
jgi:hypothetical protein